MIGRTVDRIVRTAAIAFSIAAMACGPGASTGGPTTGASVVIRGEPDCEQCRLDMTLEVTLRDRPELGRQVVGNPQTVVRDSTGRIFHVHGMDASSIHVFAADGEYRQSVGSRGQAPGEFSSVRSLLVDADDHLYAFDRERLTVFTPELDVRDTTLLPIRVRKTLFVDGGILAAAPLLGEDGVGMPLHVLGVDLQIVRSFGAMENLTAQNWQFRLLRGIAGAGDGSIWAHPVNRYQIEEWDPATGTRQRTFERVVDWFEAWTESRPASFDEPPQPNLATAWLDADGLLWTLTSVGAAEWHEGLVVLSGFNDVWVEYPELFRDTHIEVIDPETGRLLLSERVPQALGGVTNDGFVVGRRYPEGEPYQVDLWRLRLAR